MTKKAAPFFTLASITIILYFSASLALNSNYGGDNDTYGVLSTFLNMLINGQYSPSRYTGYPVSELGIGSLAYLGGSKLSNIVTYALHVGGVILLPLTLRSRLKYLEYLTYVLLALSSPLIFDNIQSTDYSWAFFFFVGGLVLKRRFSNSPLSILGFSLSIGSRPSFFVLVLVALVYCDYEKLRDHKFSNLNRQIISYLTEIFAVIFVSSLFFVPVWILHRFSFSWVSAAPPYDQGLVGLVSRFLYKIILTCGVIQSLIIFIAIIAFIIALLSRKNALNNVTTQLASIIYRNGDLQLFSVLIFANLLLFLSMPVEPSYLQPSVIFFYLLLSSFFAINFFPILFLIACLNVSSWFYSLNLLDINYASSQLCDPVVAKSANLNIHFEPGRMLKHAEHQSKSTCYHYMFSKFIDTENITQIDTGASLKVMTK